MSMNMGDRLRYAREARKLTQTKLGAMCGVGQGTISKTELKSQTTSGFTAQLAKALEVDPHWLATGEGESGLLDDSTNKKKPETVKLTVLSAQLSMGTGMADYGQHDEEVREIETTPSWVRHRLSKATAVSNIRIVTGLGDSMKPTIGDGDAVFVDTGVTRADIDAVYALVHNNELFLKRIQRLPGGRIKLISDNRSAYDPVVIEFKDIGDFQVLGRVIGAMNFNEL